MPSWANRRHRNCRISKDQHRYPVPSRTGVPVARNTHTNVIALHTNSGRGAVRRKSGHQAESVTDIPYDVGTVRGGPFLAEPDFDGLAWQFLHSDYAGAMHAQWPLDRRLEGFLHDRGLTRVADDGDLYNMV